MKPLLIIVLFLVSASLQAQDARPPNILFAISDDQSFAHTGANGDAVVATPAFDRIAREGINFTHAFTAAPSCTPSRGAILTGQEIYRLEQGGVLFGTLPARFPVYPRLLEEAGYHIGWVGVKAWGPGMIAPGGRTEDPAGPHYNDRLLPESEHRHGFSQQDYAANFIDLVGDREPGQPFAAWYGAHEPHRDYDLGAGVETGKELAEIQPFSFWPDLPEVRSDIADYYVEIERFDRDLARMLAYLEEIGELDNTIVIVTSDHGMPFPRCKANLYDCGTRVPFAVRYPPLIEGGRIVDDFVSLTDVAPTVLDLAGVDIPDDMTGQSLEPVLTTTEARHRTFTVSAFERHTLCRPNDVGYPMRMIRTPDWLYIRNYAPDRWPAGNPDVDSIHQGIFGDCDRGATRTVLIDGLTDSTLAPYARLAFDKRSAEELYFLPDDPDQLHNLAADSAHAAPKARLQDRLNAYLDETEDPRRKGLSPWDAYPYYFQDYWKRPGAFPMFELHRIDTVGSKLGQTALVDVDQDGDLDWIAGEADHGGSRIWWWEYQEPDQWVRHTLGQGNTDVGGAAHDVDGDGWVDFLAGSVLLMNTGQPRSEPFTPHEVGTIYSHDTEFADVNGDGRLDALANSDRTGLFWYEVPEDPMQTWTAHPIATIDEHEIHGGISPHAVGDLDGDGDADVVTGQGWYENTDGSGTTWTPHLNIDFGEHHQYGLAVRTWVADLDGDGDLDVIQSEADNPDGRVAWFENDGTGTWTRHLIKDKGDRQDFHALAVADFDLDGDLDVFAGGGPLSAEGHYRSYIWENTVGPLAPPVEGTWVEHIVARKPVHEVEAADVDGDGDVDLVAKPWSVGNEHVFLRNMKMEHQE